MMERNKYALSLILFWVISLLFNLFISPTSLYAAEFVNSFDADITINEDSSITVKELIDRTFEGPDRHGIIRKIPLSKKNIEDKTYLIETEVISVTDENGNPYNYTTYNEGDFLNIKIGDPDKTITGTHKYLITYKMLGAITYFTDHDELYWNITGDDWTIPIGRVSAKIRMYNQNLDFTDSVCYSGVYGSAGNECKVDITDGEATVESTGIILPSENVSFAVKFPQNLVAFYEREQKLTLWDKILPYLAIGFFLFVNVLLPIGIIIYWYFTGRDPKGSFLITRQFDPPKDENGLELTPMETGAIVDEVINPRDISAEIVNLAIKKIIKIREINKKSFIFNDRDILFERGLNFDLNYSGLKPHQIEIIKAIGLDNFNKVSLDDIKSGFSSNVKTINDDLYSELASSGYFKSNPQKTRNIFYGIGAASMIFFAFFLGLVIIFFAKFMPRKTPKGVIAREQALGLKEFLNSQDRQLEFQENNYYFFEKLLPYAITFGVTNVWAQKFAHLSEYKPEWFESDQLNNLTTLAIIDRLNSNLNTIQTSYQTSTTTSSGGFSSGFGGGGFSGGGFGGGGGSSW